MWNTNNNTEKGVLIGLQTPEQEIDERESLSELYQLARTAGAEIKGKFLQSRRTPHNAFYIGPGKLSQVKDFIKANKLNLCVVDDELTPTQERNLEEELKCKVIDRTRLILDIFAIHASSSVGKLQVELAQMEYFLPRLKNIWTDFSKLGGGIGTRMGPGEKKIEVDRRIIGDRISSIRKKLDKIGEKRKDISKKRKKSFLKTVSLVGYTNTGKSSLMNILSGADVIVKNRLFATLSSKTKKVRCGKYDVLLSDTVGFIRKLPHQVVEAFMATLEEIKDADLLLHVVDVSNENYRHQIEAVNNVLGELKVMDKPIITVYNKTDKTPHSAGRKKGDPAPVFISAKYGEGINSLKKEIELQIDNMMDSVELKIPQARQKVINSVHRNCYVESRKYDAGSVIIRCKMDSGIKDAFGEYLLEK